MSHLSGSHLELDWPGVDVLDEPLLVLEPGDKLLDPGQLLGVVCLLDVDQAPLPLGGEVGLVGVIPVVHYKHKVNIVSIRRTSFIFRKYLHSRSKTYE